MNIIVSVLLIYLLTVVVRIIKGPTIWDRFLGFSIFSSKIVILIVVAASIMNVGYLLDLALIYALFGILGEIFIILFLSKRVKEGNEE
ncbi:MAG: monovalent cation/H+ antiporter complex subunit F [Defluviitaleaceae bacterium]|nr:monovalent cation/H+ antiporter complex subunit F [Defluviitaleaceae bacterium]